jgi:hypothetical protein
MPVGRPLPLLEMIKRGFSFSWGMLAAFFGQRDR